MGGQTADKFAHADRELIRDPRERRAARLRIAGRPTLPLAITDADSVRGCFLGQSVCSAQVFKATAYLGFLLGQYVQKVDDLRHLLPRLFTRPT